MGGTRKSFFFATTFGSDDNNYVGLFNDFANQNLLHKELTTIHISSAATHNNDHASPSSSFFHQKHQHDNVMIRGTRVRRSVTTLPDGLTKLVTFTAFDRNFALRMRPDIIPVIDYNNTKVDIRSGTSGVSTIQPIGAYLANSYYFGYDEHDTVSIAHGIIDPVSGSFEGIVYLEYDKFLIQASASGKSTAADTAAQQQQVIVYRESDLAVLDAKSGTSAANQKIPPETKICSLPLVNPEYNYYPPDNHTTGQFRIDTGNVDLIGLASATDFPRLKDCPATVTADSNFYVNVCKSNIMKCVQKIVYHMIETAIIFTSTDFTGDGKADHMGVQLARAVVYTDQNAAQYPATIKHTYTVAGNYLTDITNNVQDKDGTCISIWFTFYAFYPTLGVAYQGAICTKNSAFGIITFADQNGSVSSPLTMRGVVTHEIGHLFGSPHDYSAACTPGNDTTSFAGNYLMFWVTAGGFKPNNDVFSTCSKSNIQQTVTSLMSQNELCFVPALTVAKDIYGDPGTPVSAGGTCGDGIVDVRAGEQCDCGANSTTCSSVDACCVPPGVGTGCRFKIGAACSARDLCCNPDTCAPKPNTAACVPRDKCRLPAMCDGKSSMCVAAQNVADGTPCHNGRRMCATGECTVTRCAVLNMVDCVCDDTFDKLKTGRTACKLCCSQESGGTCAPITTYLTDSKATTYVVSPPTGIQDIYLLTNDLCMSGAGSCQTVPSNKFTNNKNQSWCLQGVFDTAAAADFTAALPVMAMPDGGGVLKAQMMMTLVLLLVSWLLNCSNGRKYHF